MRLFKDKLILIITIVIIALAIVVVALMIVIRVRNVRAVKEELAVVTEQVRGSAAGTVTAEEADSPYILPDSSTRLYTAEELEGLTKSELRIARNEIYARHGRRFESQDLQNYFDSKSWYNGTIAPEDFNNNVLSDIELKNIALIEDVESNGMYILPESSTRVYSQSELDGLTKAELRLARNEIYARHGRKFDSQDLQDYFNSQPWYNGTIAPEDFDPSVLSSIEQQNIAAIEQAEASMQYVLPESNTRVYSQNELEWLTAADLRIARNEIYARHGRRFYSQDLQDYFNSKSWYNGTIAPNDFDPSVFNQVEEENIAVILRAEKAAAASAAGSVTPKSTDTSYDAFSKSWETIKSYGFGLDQSMIFGDYYSSQWSYSPLSFTIIGGTAVDCGEYYAVQAVFAKPLKVPAYPNPGDTYTTVVNELTGQKGTFTYVREEGTGATYYRSEGGSECWITNIGSDGMAELLEGSVDRIDVPFYEGVLWVSKSAVTGSTALGSYSQVTASDFAENDWFNAVAFDANGYVQQLIYVGD